MISKNKILIILLSLVLIFLSLFLIRIKGKNKNPDNLACFKNNCFSLEIAETQEQRDRGLMFRQNLDQGKGMLFIFDNEGIYPFWMKNTLLPLDIIWIDTEYKVVFIKENAMPCEIEPCETFIPDAQAIYALEVNSGVSDKIGLKIGDSIDINMIID